LYLITTIPAPPALPATLSPSPVPPCPIPLGKLPEEYVAGDPVIPVVAPPPGPVVSAPPPELPEDPPSVP